MNAIAPPNYTKTPNVLFDKYMRVMGEAELRVVMAAIRKILGWHKDKPEAISISQFMELTGMSKFGVRNGIQAAIERGILREAGKGVRGVGLYTLNISDDATGNAGIPELVIQEYQTATMTSDAGIPELVIQNDQSTPATGNSGIPTKERGNKGKKPAAQTQNPTPRDLMVDAYWEGVDGFGTPPRYLLQDAAELIEMGATADDVRQMAADKQSGRSERYELRWLVEDWPDWKAEQRRKAADRAEVERGRRQMEQHRAAMREARGSDQ